MDFEYKIIGDSSCDLTEEMKEELGALDTIPFAMTIAGETVIDDESLSVPDLIEKMKNCNEKMTSACPSPYDFKEAFVKAKKSFCVTISSKLSGSYSSAVIGKKLAASDGAETHVFDSLSAACGEVLVARKIRELLNNGEGFSGVVEKMNGFIADMKTFFVLDDVSNLVKNGRMGKITGALVSVLGIKPVLGAKDGEIELYGKVRGRHNIVAKLLDAIADCGRKIKGDDLVISHCNNLELAQELLERAQERFDFSPNSKIVETRGLSTFYTCDKGIVLSF